MTFRLLRRVLRSRPLSLLAAGSTLAAGLGLGPPTLAHAYLDRHTVGAAAVASLPTGSGYWVATSYGAVLNFGYAQNYGSITYPLNQPIVGMAATSDGGGYWLVAADGGIFPFGDAPGWGSMGGQHLNQPIVGMASSPQNGYWLVASDGGIFPFGPATGYGSTGNIRLNQPMVAMASPPAGDGYWLVAADGGVFPFGPGAIGYGSTGGIRLNRPIVGIAAAPAGHGYWLVASDGGIFPFGPTAAGYGATGGMALNAPIVDMASAAGGSGYWLLARDGGIFPFGPGAPGYGSAAGRIAAYTLDDSFGPECGNRPTLPPGKVILISLACQKLVGYQDASPLYVTEVTTGRPELPTPPGSYWVHRKNTPWHMVSDFPTDSPYWYAPTWVQYTLWFRDDGYAIHDAPWRDAYGPGTNLAGSHGCVNVPMPIMASLFSWADVGMPVLVF